MATDLRTYKAAPLFTDGYAILYSDAEDKFYAMHGTEIMQKKSGQPATYKNLAQAVKFLTDQGICAETEAEKQARHAKEQEAEREARYARMAEENERERAKRRTYCKDCGTDLYNGQEQCYECSLKVRGTTVEQDTAVAFDVLAEAEEAWINRFEQPLPEPQDPMADVEEVEFVGSDQHQVGETITDKYGAQFVVLTPSYYVSPQEAADLEDGWDANVEAGWHTKARRK